MNTYPFYVAEVSANHNGDLKRAKKIVQAAANSGASAVKFQTYTPETMTLPIQSFKISSDHELWGGKGLFDLYQQAMTPWEWHPELFSFAREFGLVPFSSPFDHSAVDFLEQLGCEMYKVASLETGDTDLISHISQTGKPIVISTGASTLSEIQDAVNASLSGATRKVSLLVCTSAYPAKPKEAHINRISTLRNEFGLDVGLSDHTLGVGVALGAIALGATIIEKHLTLKRSDGSADSAFSMEPHEFELLVKEGNNLIDSLGTTDWNIQDSENESRRLRRSLFIAKDVKKGEIATRENIKALRPNLGGQIRNIELILGKHFVRDFQAGSPALIDSVE